MSVHAVRMKFVKCHTLVLNSEMQENLSVTTFNKVQEFLADYIAITSTKGECVVLLRLFKD